MQIESTDDVSEGDVVQKGMVKFEVVTINEGSDEAFGPAWEATGKVVDYTDDEDDGAWTNGDTKTFSETDLKRGYEVVA